MSTLRPHDRPFDMELDFILSLGEFLEMLDNAFGNEAEFNGLAHDIIAEAKRRRLVEGRELDRALDADDVEVTNASQITSPLYPNPLDAMYGL